MKICLIDDDQFQHFILNEQLKLLDHQEEILSFEEAELALEYFNQHVDALTRLPDLILLDLNMHLMDGWEFLDLFADIQQKIAKPIDIQILSSSIDTGDLNKAKNYKQVSNYHEKPLKIKSLESIINK